MNAFCVRTYGSAVACSTAFLVSCGSRTACCLPWCRACRPARGRSPAATVRARGPGARWLCCGPGCQPACQAPCCLDCLAGRCEGVVGTLAPGHLPRAAAALAEHECRCCEAPASSVHHHACGRCSGCCCLSSWPLLLQLPHRLLGAW